MFWNNLVALCNQKNTTPTAVVNALGIAAGSVTKWKAGATPRSTTLQKLADYFGVSVDYLLGKTEQKEKPSPEGESDEAMKVALFGGDTEVTDEMWREVLNYAEFIKQKYNKT